MLINTAIAKAKAQEEEKVAISLKVSVNTKAKLQSVADENGVSLNSLCTSILESVLDGNIDEKATFQLVEELNKAKDDLESARKMIESGHDTVFANNDRIIDFNLEEKVAHAKILGITAELERRGRK